jgi:DNA replication protein DnaC
MSTPTKLGEAVAKVVADAQAAVQRGQAEDAAEMGVPVEKLTEARERQERAENREQAVLRSGIQITREDLRAIVTQRFARTKALETVERFCAATDARPIILLCGGTGSGKTFAGAVAIASLGRGVAVRAPELAARMAPWPSELAAGFERLNTKEPLVILDDLGTERDPEDARWADALLSFVEARSLYGKTIITSNLRKATIAKRYGARTIDRLDR